MVPDGAYIYDSQATLFWPTENETTPAPTCVVDVQEGKITVDMTPREESVEFLLPRGSVIGTLSNIENSLLDKTD